jgi:hypothetical protein
LVVVICLIVVVGLGVVGLVVATAPPIWKFTIAPSDRDSRQQPQTTRRVKRYVQKSVFNIIDSFMAVRSGMGSRGDSFSVNFKGTQA